MKYISTRGGGEPLNFEQVTLAGLAGDGGLYVPTHWPKLTQDEIADLAGLPYTEVAVRVMKPFIGDALTEEELRDLCEKAYSRFAHDAVTTFVDLDGLHWLLALFHGQPLALNAV